VCYLNDGMARPGKRISPKRDNMMMLLYYARSGEVN